MENTENVQATPQAEPHSDTAVGSNPLLSLRSTRQLVSHYVWGSEPDDQCEVIAELRKRHVDVDDLQSAVESLITKYSRDNDKLTDAGGETRKDSR
jgi:hypothetical protein